MAEWTKGDNDSEDEADDCENGDEEEDSITPDGRNTGRSNHLPITRRLPSTSTKEHIEIECAESDSDLGDEEERIPMHNDYNILSDDDTDGDDSTPKGKLTSLRTCSTFFIMQSMAGTGRWAVTTTFS
jgi:hypothetical protein